MKDFSRPRERIQFTIDGDTFEAAPAVPAEILVEFANRFTDVNTKPSTPSEQFETVTAVLQLVLLEESYKRLTARARDLDHPVEIDQLSDVILWLLEEYGMRPTQPSSSSSTGPASPASGTSLTATTPDVASTFLPSPSIAS